MSLDNTTDNVDLGAPFLEVRVLTADGFVTCFPVRLLAGAVTVLGRAASGALLEVFCDLLFATVTARLGHRLHFHSGNGGDQQREMRKA